jgi:hypothetical protein
MKGGRTMKGKEIINHIVKAKMPDAEQVREKCVRQTLSKPQIMPRKVWLSASVATACMALVLTLVFMLQLGGGAEAFALSITIPNGSTIIMEDKNSNQNSDDIVTSVSYVDSRPHMRFFITGVDIARIEISTNSEYVRAHDWTESLDEVFWNPELHYAETEIDGVVYQYLPARSGFEKSIVLIFPEDFKDYEQVWYEWHGLNIYDWARENESSRFQGYNGMSISEIEEQMDGMTEEEKLAIAASGGDTSAAGHILLDGYPVELLNDHITITITDRQGNTITKTLIVDVSNNALGQTVVTASMNS